VKLILAELLVCFRNKTYFALTKNETGRVPNNAYKSYNSLLALEDDRAYYSVWYIKIWH
jgi:hypothetical protein